MNYRTDRSGNQLSILGFGCMRFKHKLGRIDMVETDGRRGNHLHSATVEQLGVASCACAYYE